GNRQWRNCRNGCSVIESFAGVPGLTVATGLGLQIAACHVQAKCVAKNMRLRVTGPYIATTLADCNHQFAFVMQIARPRRIRHATVGYDGVGRFQKETWWLARWIRTHFAYMRRIILAHAIDAMYWKHP